MAKKPNTIEKPQPVERHFRIVHDMVGGFPKDRIVSESEFNELHGKGVDLNRLIRVGAIKESTAELTDGPLPAGPFNTDGGDSGSEAPPIHVRENFNPDDVHGDKVQTNEDRASERAKALEHDDLVIDDDDEVVDDDDDLEDDDDLPPSARAKKK